MMLCLLSVLNSQIDFILTTTLRRTHTRISSNQLLSLKYRQPFRSIDSSFHQSHSVSPYTDRAPCSQCALIPPSSYLRYNRSLQRYKRLDSQQTWPSISSIPSFPQPLTCHDNHLNTRPDKRIPLGPHNRTKTTSFLKSWRTTAVFTIRYTKERGK